MGIVGLVVVHGLKGTLGSSYEGVKPLVPEQISVPGQQVLLQSIVVFGIGLVNCLLESKYTTLDFIIRYLLLRFDVEFGSDGIMQASSD